MELVDVDLHANVDLFEGSVSLEYQCCLEPSMPKGIEEDLWGQKLESELDKHIEHLVSHEWSS